jgi:hypothetical protein
VTAGRGVAAKPVSRRRGPQLAVVRRTAPECRHESPDGASIARVAGTRRLLVELNHNSTIALEKLEFAEGLNKSTLVNRAIQVYAWVWGVQRSGGQLLVANGESRMQQRVRFR